MTTIDLTAISDEWEELVSTGIELAQHMDTGRWALGDLAGRVEKRYGQDAIGTFAGEIGMARKATLKQYRQVSARYESATRVAFPTLTWTHFRDAMRAKDDAELWLAQAADQNWPVAELGRQIAAAIGKPVPPKLLYDDMGAVWQVADVARPYLVLLGDMSALAEGMKVRVKVYEREAE